MFPDPCYLICSWMFSELERFCWFHTWFYLGLTINWITSSCSFCQHKVQDMLQKRKSSSIGAMNHYTQIRHDELLFCSYMLIATWKFQDNSVCVRNKRDKTIQTRLPVLKEFSHPSWSPSLCFIPSYNHHPNALVFPAAAAALLFFFSTNIQKPCVKVTEKPCVSSPAVHGAFVTASLLP